MWNTHTHITPSCLYMWICAYMHPRLEDRSPVCKKMQNLNQALHHHHPSVKKCWTEILTSRNYVTNSGDSQTVEVHRCAKVVWAADLCWSKTACLRGDFRYSARSQGKVVFMRKHVHTSLLKNIILEFPSITHFNLTSYWLLDSLDTFVLNLAGEDSGFIKLWQLYPFFLMLFVVEPVWWECLRGW